MLGQSVFGPALPTQARTTRVLFLCLHLFLLIFWFDAGRNSLGADRGQVVFDVRELQDPDPAGLQLFGEPREP